ncbi:DUF6056 family protein [Staphylococcus simiae]|uniref:Glucosyltransferase n=1 Tax=Staphylococcus simiae CCM 7213 = CCUG 51256 TaxID=911238 RepID=G5JLB5_9STAP|nr:DUF6056 family protein [Staphylococcus simiae]EHJ07023.1 hypothetical protein SS7213T_11410 [Staphylococcus simiae CCM 7213 = CCUG 51256]PNZ12143.1 hypothetical protein CD113_07285 [Staphylococcus simiae]SNV74297.1 glucosyltransferase [Staphylococcus simiae]
MNIKQLEKTTITLIAILIFYILLGFFLPLMHDDLLWYSDYGNSMLNSETATLNGRYLGNFFEMIAVKISWIRWLTYGLTSVGLIWLIIKTIDAQKNIIFYFITFIMMLIMPSQIFSQTFGWFAGFYNYVPPILSTLFIIHTILNIIVYNKKMSVHNLVIFYIVCLIGQLFIENITVFNCMFLFLSLIYYFVSYRMINTKLLFGFLMSTIGTMLMFSNPNYHKIFFEGATDYQQVSNDKGFFTKIFETTTSVLPNWIYYNEIVIVIITTLILLFLLIKSKRFSQLDTLKRKSLIVGLLLLPTYYFIIYNQFELAHETHVSLFNIASTLICIIYIVAMILTMSIVLIDRKELIVTYIIMVSMHLISITLIIVSPIGPRNFLIVYVMHLIIVLMLLKRVCDYITFNLKWTISVATVLALVYLSTFSFINHQNELRVQNLKQQIKAYPKKKVYTLPLLPFEHYMQKVTPNEEKYQKFFNEYHGIPDDIKVKYIPFGTNKND